jgi:hypothetical protein
MKKNRIGMGFLAAAFMLGLVFTAQTAKAESHFSFGVSVGPSYGYYAPPPAIYWPAYPGPGYYWTDGYYDPYGVWIDGFWAPRGYVRPYAYIAPRVYDRGYFGGYRRGFDRDDFRRRDFDRDDHRRRR